MFKHSIQSKNKTIKNNIRTQLNSVSNYIQKLDEVCDKDSYEEVYKIQCFLEEQLEKHNRNMNLISSPTQKFLDIIIDSKIIGEDSEQGVVQIVTIKMNDKNKVKKVKAILKYAKGFHKDVETVLHEVTVGYFLNHLRKDGNLNFMYVYTPFYCSVGKELCTSTNVNKLTTCAFFEFIQGKSIRQTMKENCRNNVGVMNTEFIKIFLQIVLALADAQAYCKFVHYDLHSENVIIHTSEEPKTITYKHIGYKLKNVKQIPIIIDYGNSVVTSPTDKNVYLGPFTDKNSKIKYFEDLAYTKEPFLSCYDVFHLAMMSLYSIVRCETEEVEDVKKIWNILMSFFVARVQSGNVNVSSSCKKYLLSQTFTSDGLYYRLKVQDKELVNIDIKQYILYLIKIIQPNNLDKI